MLSEDDVTASLLQFNYLPRQKTAGDELPPVFSSSTFTWAAALPLLKTKTPKGGYDVVDIGQTRADGKLRVVSIPHPVAYAQLVEKIRDSWSHISGICSHKKSRIRPHLRKDGRIFVMNYGHWKSNKADRINLNFGKKVLVRADISNFFGSIYTHSLPWALVGLKNAKKTIGHKNWYNDIDSALQKCKRNETNGIPVGPGTSNIVAEAILGTVDVELSKFDFLRYIDDYYCYCDSHDEASRFLIELEESLRKFKLQLNHRKTEIVDLPAATDSDWVIAARQLIGQLPETIRPSNAINFLDHSLSMTQKFDNPNVMKYVFTAISSKKLHYYTPEIIMNYAFMIINEYPAIISKLGRLIDFGGSAINHLFLREKLFSLIDDSIKRKRTDLVCWCLYYLKKINQNLDDGIFQNLLKSRDCLSLLMCYYNSTKAQRDSVVDFTKRAVNAPDDHDRHRYWILIYELYRNKSINKVGNDKAAFDSLIASGVRFYDD